MTKKKKKNTYKGKVLNIVKADDPGNNLREYCQPVKEDEFNDLIPTILDMKKTVTVNKALGLAAPQIGISKRFFVMKVGNGFLEFINPVLWDGLIETEEDFKVGEITDYEGCLSLPGNPVKIARPEKVKIEGYSVNGEKRKFTFKKTEARIVMHEMDHLNGTLVVDYEKGDN